jgi:hypothetical protein
MQSVFAAWFRVLVLAGAFQFLAPAENAAGLVHGLWVWKSQDVLRAPSGADALLRFCESQGINEVYLSVAGDEQRLARVIALLHRSDIRVEALLSSVDADQPGKHRDKLVSRVQGIVRFNQNHGKERFDGIHLDVEPHQRRENKGPGNLRFLPDLVSTYRVVRGVAEPAGMTVNADVPIKYLKGQIGERRMLLLSVPRLTLMLYELDSPDQEKLQKAAQRSIEMAYEDLSSEGLARISVALRTPDYGELLPARLQSLDETMGGNPHYLGWARHSYNDTLIP